MPKVPKKKPRKLPAAVELGRRGGIATRMKLTSEQRSENARKAVMARWARKTKEKAIEQKLTRERRKGKK